MDIKLVITDLDGTLLDAKKEIHPDFWPVHRQLTDKGILFAVASGRQLSSLESTFTTIGNDTLFIAENGTIVRYKGEVIHENALEMAAASLFIHTGRCIEGAEIVLCGKDAAYVECTEKQFLEEVSKYYNRLQIVDDLTLVNDTILKVAIYDFYGAETNSYGHFKIYENDYKVAVSGPEWLDLTHPTANKGTAIEKVQEKLGISKEETMAFGDFLNDLEMMAAAGHSYAMKNAHPDILKASRFITQFDNNENGVVQTIMQKFNLTSGIS